MNSLLKGTPDKLFFYKEAVTNASSHLDLYANLPASSSSSSADNATSLLLSLTTAAPASGGGGGRSLAEMIVLGTVLGSLDLITILGNLLVCFTILSNKRLQNATNFFIFSLSLSDLLLGLLVLPFSTLTTLTDGAWPLGAVFCNIYVACDVMLCTVSILQLFVISLDRYLAVTWPFRYLQQATHRRVYAICCGIWVFSFAMGFAPIHLGWNTESGNVQNFESPGQCVFESNEVYVLLVAISTYFCPLIIMCAVYVRVYAIARQQVKRINELTQYGTVHSTERQAHMASDAKATFTLASVVTAFTICWLPYFVLFTAKPFLQQPVDPHVDLFMLWLGYVNSLLNPFLYAFHNTEFRYGFMLVLCRSRAEKYRQRNPDVVHL